METESKIKGENKMKKEITVDDKLMMEFLELVSRLSPENLSCDGESTITNIRAKRKQIMIEWKELETKLGNSITEDEIWDWYDKHGDGR